MQVVYSTRVMNLFDGYDSGSFSGSMVGRILDEIEIKTLPTI